MHNQFNIDNLEKKNLFSAKPEVRVIKNLDDYKTYTERVRYLSNIKESLGLQKMQELELLEALINLYELELSDSCFSDPVSVIKSMMKKKGLTRKDLVKYIGAHSKVSEVLNRKRPLSLNMIRRLHQGLNIPANILIQKTSLRKSASDRDSFESFDWLAFPLKEMQKRGYFEGKNSIESLSELRLYAENRVLNFFGSVPNYNLFKAASTNINLSPKNQTMDKLSLLVWQAKVLKEAAKSKIDVVYEWGTVDFDFLKDVVKNFTNEGPQSVKLYLAKFGICFVIEPCFKKANLDGAVYISKKENPVIAMTLNQDRYDIFLITLVYLLTHIALDSDNRREEWFIDWLDFSSGQLKENERNLEIAEAAFIPNNCWIINQTSSIDDMIDLAKKLNISPTMVFGRYARTYNNFGKVKGYIPKISAFLGSSKK